MFLNCNIKEAIRKGQIFLLSSNNNFIIDPVLQYLLNKSNEVTQV